MYQLQIILIIQRTEFSTDECIHQPCPLFNVGNTSGTSWHPVEDCSFKETRLITNTREIINNERSTFPTFDTLDIRDSYFGTPDSQHSQHSRLSTFPFCVSRYSFPRFILWQSQSPPTRCVRRPQEFAGFYNYHVVMTNRTISLHI